MQKEKQQTIRRKLFKNLSKHAEPSIGPPCGMGSMLRGWVCLAGGSQSSSVKRHYLDRSL